MLLEVASLFQVLQKWQDLQGPKIRVGALKDGPPVKLVDGARLTITTHEIA